MADKKQLLLNNLLTISAGSNKAQSYNGFPFVLALFNIITKVLSLFSH